MRHQLGVGYNIPSTIKMAVDFALSFLSDKLRSRSRQVTDLSSCPEIDRTILPLELGGGPLRIDEMIKLWKVEMSRQPEILRLVAQNDEMAVNLQLFTKREVEGEFRGNRQNVIDQHQSWGMESVQGSFRKMEVD